MKKVYTIYATIIVLVSFLMVWPFFFLFLQKKSWYSSAHNCNRAWGKIVYFLCGIPLKVTWHFKPNPLENYIFCVNHSSYSDIPTMYLATKGDIVFIGKSSLGKVPLFGYMYKRLHILVDRRSVESKKETLIRSKQVIDNGKSLVFFPEGTIAKLGTRPEMIAFKDGPFKIAIDKKVKIVPVTLPYNWLILPDEGDKLATRHICEVIFHEPIETKHLTDKDIVALKDKTFDIIYQELKKHNKHLV